MDFVVLELFEVFGDFFERDVGDRWCQFVCGEVGVDVGYVVGCGGW